MYLPKSLRFEVESFFGNIGGPFSADLITEDDAEWLDMISFCVDTMEQAVGSLTSHISDGPCYFAFSSSPTNNAVVRRFDDFYCILITAGLVTRVANFMAHLATDPGFQAFILTGTDPDEAAAPLEITREEAVASLLKPAWVRTTDSDRLAKSMIYAVLFFVIAHEVGHIALGHLGNAPLTGISECSATEEMQPAAFYLNKRAKEWDADGFATVATWYNLHFLSQTGGWAGTFINDDACLRAFCASAYCFFTIMDLSSGHPPLERRTHPRPLVRVGLNTTTLVYALLRLGQMLPSDTWSVSRRAVRSVEISMQNLAGGVMRPELADSLTNELQEEVSRLTPIFNQMLPTLDRSRMSAYWWASPLNEEKPVYLTPSDQAD